MNAKIRNSNRLHVAAACVLVMSVSSFPIGKSDSETASVKESSALPAPIFPSRHIVPVTKTAGISAQFEERFSAVLKRSLPKPNEKSFVLQSCKQDGGKRIARIDEMLAAEICTDYELGASVESNYANKCLWCRGQGCGFTGDDHTPISDYLRHQLHIKASDSEAVYRAASHMLNPNSDVLPAQVISTWLAAVVSWLFVRVRKRRSLILRQKAPGNT